MKRHRPQRYASFLLGLSGRFFLLEIFVQVQQILSMSASREADISCERNIFGSLSIYIGLFSCKKSPVFAELVEREVLSCWTFSFKCNIFVQVRHFCATATYLVYCPAISVIVRDMAGQCNNDRYGGTMYSD